MKPIIRAKIAYYKWTAIILFPTLFLLATYLLTCYFKQTKDFSEKLISKIYLMIDHRAYKTRVAYRGYELVLKL